jgi:hypothetical protein
MRYLDIKIVEEKTNASPAYAESDLFDVIVKIDTQEELFKIPKVPFSTFSKGKDDINDGVGWLATLPLIKIFTTFIKNNSADVAKSFNIVNIQVVDPNGKKMPLEDLFPSVDGDTDSALDNYRYVTLRSRLIAEYEQWLADESQTEFKQDSRSRYEDITGKPLTKDNLRFLTVEDDGSLIDPRTKRMIGAIEGTSAAVRYNKAVKDGKINTITVGVIAIGGGLDGSSGDAGFQGKEGALTGEQKVAIPTIIEELRDSIKGLGTNEGKMFTALKRIESTAHLDAVIAMYKETYKDDLLVDIKYEFYLDPGGNTKEQITELNVIMKKFGIMLTPQGKLGAMRWKKVDPNAKPNGLASDEPVKIKIKQTDQVVSALIVYWNNDRYVIDPMKRKDGKYYGALAGPGTLNLTRWVDDKDLIKEIDTAVKQNPDLVKDRTQL